ncbi:DHH phosphoesterase [Rhizopogon salebrosus TDB-379]|nr:DHH phosphoesterase [Rhizopogon salebrosus TDB-379]
MSPVTPTFSSLLKSQKDDFIADNGKGWSIVMGNEAGDLDSIASALVYAWLCSRTAGGKAIAYITTPRQHFYLREENLHALHLAGIKEPFEELYCSGDPIPSQASQFALVDHNVLDTRYASPAATVVAIIDHHTDENKHKTADPRIIEPVGSCASLVTRLFSSSHVGMPPELATLLLSAILIDTKGLKPGGKACPADMDAAAFLLPLSPLTGCDAFIEPSDIPHLPSVQFLSAILDEKKSNVSHLSTVELLRRDYKEYTFNVPSSDFATQSFQMITVGLATVPLRLSDFFASSEFSARETETEVFAGRNLNILGVLTTYRNKNDKGRREQLWIVRAADEGIAKKLWPGLESNDVLQLERVDLTELISADNAEAVDEFKDKDAKPVSAVTDEQVFGDPESFIVRAYKQGNAKATRKQTAPILRAILEGTL